MKLLETQNSSATDNERNKETADSNTVYTVSPTTHTNTTIFREPYDRIIQNFRLVWLDKSIDEVTNDDSINIITKLRQVVDTVNIFTDVSKCIDFISGIKEEKVFVIFPGVLAQTIVPSFHDMAQINCIYIFCEHKAQHEHWANQWSKVKGVFTDITSICGALKQSARECDQNSISISFVRSTDVTSKQNLDQLDKSFMYTQILKEILLTIDFEEDHISEFLTYCQERFASNGAELTNVEKLRKEYRHHRPLWWYTYTCFLYSMLNRALRMMEVDLIIKMGFFLRDLHNDIVALHAEQYNEQQHSDSFVVYRGQGLSQIDFDQLMKTKGGLMSFNNFLSTSRDQAVSYAFAESNQYNPDLIGILFKITIDPSVPSTSFANIRNVSAYETEEEILFSMHSVFRIGQVKQIDENNRLWEVDLTLTSDTDPQLHALTESVKDETKGSTGWLRLGKLMVKLAQYTKAQDLYEILLKQETNETDKGDIYHQVGLIQEEQGEYAKAITFYEESLKIRQKILTPQHPDVAECYEDIGNTYDFLGDDGKALSYHEKALEIRQNTLPENHPDLATSYNNIGSVYDKMGEYSKAISYHEKALEIYQKTLPENHPHLATSCNNIGSAYSSMGEYSKALSYYKKALEIYQRSLPENHPHLASSYAYHGCVYDKMGEYSKALSYLEKALEIYQKTLPENHPHVATSCNNIGFVYSSIGEYSKALSYYEKALEIYQTTLPEDHPHLASSYAYHGSVYDKMGEYSKALSYYEKDLEISQRNLPENHPHLALSYNNIGSMYDSMGDYLKALSYLEKGLVAYQKIFPENHPYLATSYNSIGLVYGNMSEYSKAISYHEKALEIRENNLPENHRDLATSYNNIGSVYDKMGEYSKALSFLERALNILQCSLLAEHPDLERLREIVELVKKKL
jgi:tetratricopeptide (TPR) repeat protein